LPLFVYNVIKEKFTKKEVL